MEQVGTGAKVTLAAFVVAGFLALSDIHESLGSRLGTL